MMKGLQALGVEVTESLTPDGDEIWSINPALQLYGPASIEVGNAGTVMRFVPPIAALSTKHINFDGDEAARRRPMNVTINTQGTGVIADEKIAAIVNELFDLRPKGIIQMLDLLRPIYGKTAAYGHFGREEPEFTWEKTDKAAALRAAAGL